MKRERATSCCWRERATRITRFSRTARASLTIAKWRGARFANGVLRGRKTGLAPSALVPWQYRGRSGPGQDGAAKSRPDERRSPQNVENRTCRTVLDYNQPFEEF